MTDDKKHLVQETIDRLLYCSDYAKALEEFNKQFNPHKEVKYRSITDYKFPIEKAI